MPPSMELEIIVIDSTGKKLNKIEVQQIIDELKALILADIRYNMRKDDAFLLRFLHSSKFNVEEAFKKLRGTNELRIENSDWFARCSPFEFNELLSWNAKVLLDCNDKFGRKVYFTKMANINASKTTIAELGRFDDIWMESILDDPETQAKGLCAIVDLSGFSWKMFRWLTPTNVRVSTRRIELLATKDLVIHVINSSMLLNAAVALIFPFLSAKTKEHIHFHYENWPSLHEFVDPAYLPEEYGGKLKSIDFQERNNWLIEQTSRLMENFKNDNRL